MLNFKFRRPGSCLVGSTLGALVLAAASAGHAQVLERHTPLAPETKTVPLNAPDLINSDDDDTPLGPNVQSIALLGPQAALDANLDTGIRVQNLPRLTAHSRQLEQLLTPFLHKPISRKLMSEIKTAIVKDYRDLGYPFVLVTMPPQDISAGVLRIQVEEFSVGKVEVNPTTPSAETEIANQVRLHPGDAISARMLTNDLSWVNRYPFHQYQAVFAPGTLPGTTDLKLNSVDQRAWQVYAGYSNSGSKMTGLDRYFIGGSIGNLLGYHSLLSFQGTGSSDAVAQKGRLFSFNSHPVYQSRALTYSLPVATRSQIEASLDQVESNSFSDPITSRLDSLEGLLGYRFSVSDLYNDSGLTDMRFGIEARHQVGKSIFGGLNAYQAGMDIYQLYLGYHHSAYDPMGASDLDIISHLSPGNVTAANSAAEIERYSRGRLTGATYSYLSLTYNRTTRLQKDVTLRTDVIGQFSRQPLPETEQMGLGGHSLVRGYDLEDGAADTGFVVRNDLQLAPMALGSSTLAPYGFFDIGTAKDLYTHVGLDLASAGLGTDLRLASRVSIGLNLAYALRQGPVTRSGTWKLESSLTTSF